MSLEGDDPKLDASKTAPREASKWREDITLGLEILGLAVLIIYTVFSCLQWLQIRWTNRLTREALDGNNTSLAKTLEKMQGQIDATARFADAAARSATAAETANRPYVGINGTEIVYLGKTGSSRVPTPATQTMRFTVAVKNFGPIPGTSVKSIWRVWVGGVEQTGPTTPSKAEIYFPGKTVYKTGEIGTANFPDVISGRKQLISELTIRYNGPKGSYQECEREQFLPFANAFMNLGSCTGSPSSRSLEPALAPVNRK